MSFKVIHADDDIRIGNGGTYLGSRAVFPVYRYFPVIRTLQPVGNNHLTLGGYRIETVLHGALQMVYRIGATSGIQRIAIRQKRFGSETAEQVGHACGIIRTDIRQITRFSEMYLDSGKTVFQRKLSDACTFKQTFHLV